MVILKYCNVIPFRWGADRYMTPAAKRLDAECKAFQKDLIAKNIYRSDHDGMPYKKPAFDGVFLPSELYHANEIFLGIKLAAGKRFVDLGCGDGRVVFLAALSGAIGVGIEGDEQVCGTARAMKDHLLSIPGFEALGNTEIRRADFFDENLSSFDIVFLYDPQSEDPNRFHTRLGAKLRKELNPGSLYIHCSYSVSKAYVFRAD